MSSRFGYGTSRDAVVYHAYIAPDSLGLRTRYATITCSQVLVGAMGVGKIRMGRLRREGGESGTKRRCRHEGESFIKLAQQAHFRD